ncbi:hypothetical protein K493DRAFT_258259 [Basidiobolus meristosporus CBS 931.73]|uniref:Uncharacterized protein n=1 Tax=Basidiobolus meristosporus CBS 931.73 TaxID=1314790 RepID=A0A1Y1YKE1_9FUNG|nr:hypothetical protein K493DRAFT_258259 [Basidiobolus meristosporus CBS 931.73]|eukprot:ORX98216.1 hypothetical protein K493DRAFT_258259 [Basidiobolus meristosporus CBS 931.73]
MLTVPSSSSFQNTNSTASAIHNIALKESSSRPKLTATRSADRIVVESSSRSDALVPQLGAFRVPSDPQSKELYGAFNKELDSEFFAAVSTVRSTYFFDIGRGGGFLSIPHIGSHGSVATSFIARVVEHWLGDKLAGSADAEDFIPILEDGVDKSARSILQRLKNDLFSSSVTRTELRSFAKLSKVFVEVRAGHVFSLPKCCDDATVVQLGVEEFFQEYPLFVDMSVKVKPLGPNDPRTNNTQILLSFQNITMGDCDPFILFENIDHGLSLPNDFKKM